MQIIFSTQQIALRIQELGRELTAYYRDADLTLVTIMNGGVCFAADLSRALDLPVWMDSLGVASYRNCRSTGEIEFRSTLKLPVAGRRLLVLDEVLDSGTTLLCVMDYLRKQGAAEVKSAVMVEKQLARRPEIAHADWCGFRCPDRYLVGYGLDADEMYRNLPYIAALD